jgi:hypothetical protein
MRDGAEFFTAIEEGHQLMVHVQSTWIPLIDRNPQKFEPNINTANASDFQRATMTVFRDAARPHTSCFLYCRREPMSRDGLMLRWLRGLTLGRWRAADWVRPQPRPS